MRKANLTIINGTLYEVIKSMKTDKIKKELSVDDIDALKRWVDCEFIFINNVSNEYIFLNKVPELETI
jgi:hypothetical protein